MVERVISDYKESIFQLVNEIDPKDIDYFIHILLDAYQKNSQIIVMGNGGSTATANHFVCDFGKNAVQKNKRRFRMLSVCESNEIITAIGNDVSFEEIFRQQLINLMQPDDLVIAISASGNSPDIVRACEYVKERRGRVIALTGFDGGKVKHYTDLSIVVSSNSFERVEDIHLIILHMIVCWFKENQDALIQYNSD